MDAKKRTPDHGSTPREELISMQKRLVSRLKGEIQRLVGDASPALVAYRRDYEAEVADYEADVPFEELNEAAERADVIYVGDYHTLRSSQQTALGIIEELVRRGRKVVIALELAMASRQREIEEFLGNEISEDAFLDALDYEKTWGFLWKHYRPLFDFARQERVRVVGINTDARHADEQLTLRDRFSAQIIAEECVLNPSAAVVVLDGDWHAASKHLPAAVDEELGRFLAERKSMVVFQNSDAIYWKLAALGIEHKVDLVRLREGAYCVMNAPPVVKLQSFINWQTDQDEMPTAQPGRVDVDYTGEVRAMVRTIAGFLEIEESGLDDFTVYSAGDLNFLENLASDRDFTRAEIREIKRQILRDESYFIQKKNIIYLANLSINHAAEETAHFINTVCSGYEDRAVSFREDFYRRAVKEAASFAGSRIINPKRRCNREDDFRSFLSTFSNKKELTKRERMEQEIFKLALRHLESEREYIAREGKAAFSPEQMYDHDLDVHLGVVHCLGYILGDDWSLALVRGFMGKGELRSVFYKRFEELGEAEEYYLDWVKRMYEIKGKWLAGEDREW